MLGIGDNPVRDEHPPARHGQPTSSGSRVYPLQKSRVIGVEFSAPDPELAAEVANAIADAFVALQQEAKRQSAVAATAWLQQEIERLRERVAEAEKAVADYRTAHDLFDVDQNGSGERQRRRPRSRPSSSATSTRSWRGRARRAPKRKRGPSLVQNLLDEGDADRRLGGGAQLPADPAAA